VRVRGPVARGGRRAGRLEGCRRRAEDADGLAAAAALGLEREEVRPVEPYEGSERRTLHVLRKIAPTPARLPTAPRHGCEAAAPSGLAAR
jgi:hypothetical protein